MPEGFAHGFVVLSESAEVLYKASDFYSPAYERSLLWNDPDFNITWPLDGEPVLSAKDKAVPCATLRFSIRRFYLRCKSTRPVAAFRREKPHFTVHTLYRLE